MDRSESARAELESILEANPSYTDARIVLGATLLRLDDRDGAVREWTRAAREAPDDLRPKAYLATLDSPEPSALA